MLKNILITLLISITALYGANDTELERAYAKEFAFLKAQKSALEKRLNAAQKSQTKNLANAKKEIETLQNVVLKKNVEAETKSEELFRAQQNAQNISDDTALIESVVLQSSAALKEYGKEVVVDKNDYKSGLVAIFKASDALIRELSSVRTESGEFYLQDGSLKKADIVKIGNVASYGVASDIASILIPAGEKRFKVYKAPEAAATAEALKAGQKPATLDIFIYENSAKEIEDKVEKTAYSVINSGGVIGWVIVALGIIGVLLAILRVVFLLQASATTSTLAADTLKELLAGGEEKALAFLKEKSGSTARLLKATIRNLDRDREHIEDIVAETILHESGRLDKFGSAILVIAAVAPLLGLLGTVTGMIATFDIITEFGTGDPKLLSGGISIALVTTELGLIVAIPVLMLGNLLSGWAEKVKDSMEHSALHLINEYNKQK